MTDVSPPGVTASPIQVVKTKIGTIVSGFEIMTPAVDADFETRSRPARNQVIGK